MLDAYECRQDTQHAQNQQPLSVPTLDNKIANLNVGLNDYPSFIKALEFSDNDTFSCSWHLSLSTDGDKICHGHFFWGGVVINSLILTSNVAYISVNFVHKFNNY